MSEENPVFKVTDRRLFNSDGSPRETDESNKPEAPTEPAVKRETQAEKSADATSAENGPAAAAAPAASTIESEGDQREASASPAQAESEFPDEAGAQAELPGADDPTSFINFLMSIASNAAAALGMMEHPVTGERSLDPELGKHWIDVLGMLQKKTQGNLAPQEQQIFEGLLADLRMQYVSLGSGSRSKSSHGLSGNDITGGK